MQVSFIQESIKSAAIVLLLFSGVLFAQSAETAIFRVVMLPANEVPAVNSATRGTADIVASVVRDSSGQIVSGTVDILTRITFAAAATAIGLDIRNGAAGQNGSVAIGTGMTASGPRAIQSGGDSIHIPVQVTGSDAAVLTALRGLFQDPSKFYLNLLTADLPNGAIRGQLQRAQVAVVLGQMSSDNAVPASTSFAAATAQVIAIGTRDASGNWTSGEVYLSATYFSLDPTPFSGFQIHQAAPGTTAPAAISGTLTPGLAPDPLGSAVIGPVVTEVTVTNATQLGAFSSLFFNPASLYIDLRTTGNPNGVARAQLRTTDSMSFPLALDSANEAGIASVRAAATANITFYTLRNEDGTVAAATALCDVDYRFPGAVQFIGLYVRNGVAKQSGPAEIRLAPDFHSDTGFGNYFNWSLPIDNVAAVQDIVDNPDKHYINLHTLSDPGGAVRAQLADPVTASAVVAAVIGADLDKNATTLAPGELMSIFGTHLAKVTTDLSGWAGRKLPSSLNGVTVTMGGQPAPLLYVSPGQINAQVPANIAVGAPTVVVNNNASNSAPLAVKVAASAPAIFFSPVAAILKNANFSLVSAANPARAGDVLLIYATGLGSTDPAMPTGVLVPVGTVAQTAPVTVTIGGKAAVVTYSIASPQFAGLYQVAVTVPAGVTGNTAIFMQQGSAVSNTVSIPVQ